MEKISRREALRLVAKIAGITLAAPLIADELVFSHGAGGVKEINFIDIAELQSITPGPFVRSNIWAEEGAGYLRKMQPVSFSVQFQRPGHPLTQLVRGDFIKVRIAGLDMTEAMELPCEVVNVDDHGAQLKPLGPADFYELSGEVK